MQPPQQPLSFEAKAELTVKELKTFLIIWVGQMVSGLGSSLTAFAIPVWVFQQTGSAQDFSYLMFAAMVPGLMVTPFAGAIVDRMDRKTVMILGDAGAAVMTLLIAFLFFTGRFEVWHLFPVVVFGAIMGAFQEPAFAGAMHMMVPKQHFTRAAGLMQTSGSIIGILSPFLAGTLLVVSNIPTILLIDAITFVIAMIILFFVKIPNPPRMPAMPGMPKPSLLADAMEGWKFISERRPFVGLLVFFAMFNFGMGIVMTLLSPLILTIATPQAAGAMGSATAVAGLLGGIALSVWGGPKRRMHGVLGSGVVVALGMAMAGVHPSLLAIGASLFCVSLVAPFVGASSSAIWMAKTPPALMGRVFAARKLIAMSAMPLAVLLGGFLAEHVFEPAMMPGGALAGVLGGIYGVGEGRGFGVLLTVMGLSLATLTVAMYFVPSIRNLEDIIPDAMPDTPGMMPGMPGMPPGMAPAPAPQGARPAAVPAGAAPAHGDDTLGKAGPAPAGA